MIGSSTDSAVPDDARMTAADVDALTVTGGVMTDTVAGTPALESAADSALEDVSKEVTAAAVGAVDSVPWTLPRAKRRLLPVLL